MTPPTLPEFTQLTLMDHANPTSKAPSSGKPSLTARYRSGLVLPLMPLQHISSTVLFQTCTFTFNCVCLCGGDRRVGACFVLFFKVSSTPSVGFALMTVR